MTPARLALLPLALLLTLAAASSHAALVTFRFGGQITQSRVDGVAYGDRFEGYYTFDTESVDSFENTPSTPIGDGSGPRVGIYAQNTEAAFRVGSYSVTTRFPVPADAVSGGIFVMDGIGGWDTYGVNTLAFSLSFQDPTNAAITSDDLLLTPPPLSLFPHTQFYFGQGDLIGIIDNLVIGPPGFGLVPTPGSLPLVLAGLGLAAACRSRRPSLGS